MARWNRVGLNRQLPDEPNPEIGCACGCGARFPRFDSYKRPRAYVTGHNTGDQGG